MSLENSVHRPFHKSVPVTQKTAKALADWIKKNGFESSLDLKNSGTQISVWDIPTKKRGLLFSDVPLLLQIFHLKDPKHRDF